MARLSAADATVALDGCFRGSTCGTVYKVTTSGAETVLYRFAGGSDGANPVAALTSVDGVLYGTTEAGGDSNNDGTVFEITTSGAESVLHTFGSGNDGSKPQAGLTDVNGVLYGTTHNGGASNSYGTVFKITTSGVKSSVYHFGFNDGAYPQAALTYLNGLLYGTTFEGGAHGEGTVFSVSL
jgi:uncharacterized repeat protein (TIGR03803 family)